MPSLPAAADVASFPASLGVLALGLALPFAVLRVLALRRERPWPADRTAAGRRVVAVLFPPALLEAVPAPRGGFVREGLLGIVGVGGCAALVTVGTHLALWRYARLADDLLLALEVLVGMQGLHHLAVATGTALGRPIAGVQVRPWHSLSFGEFWSARWNRMVGATLDAAIFRPVARRAGSVIGVVATFAVSGLLHVAPIVLMRPDASALKPSLLVMDFFAAQAGLVLLERRAPWRRRIGEPGMRRLARAVFLVGFVALAPLLLDVYADLTGIHGRPWSW